MALFRWGHAFDAFRDFEREVDRLVRTLNSEGFRMGRPFPAVNIYELDSEYLLTAELPGVREEELELNVSHGVLTMKGNRRPVKPIAEERYRRNERPHGPWERTFALPERLNEDEMRAELAHGVLTVHLPKAASAQPRQVPVSTGDQ